jgi:hypothetical protein
METFKFIKNEEGKTGEEQSEEYAHNFLWHQEFVLTGQIVNSA